MKVSSVIKASGILFAGVMLGIVTAQWSIEKTATAMTAGGGPWKSWFSGTASIRDPYANAHYLMFGRLPPALGQELLFEAAQDDEGAGLDGSCDYTLTGPRLSARWWQLALADAGSGEASTVTLSSSRFIGEPDGTLRIQISREPRTGNWIDSSNVSRFVMILKVRPGSGLNAGASVVTLPRIKREACT